MGKRIFNGVGMMSDIPPFVSPGGKLSEAQVAGLSDILRGVISKINGKLSMVGDGTNGSQSGNIDGQIKEFTFALANTDYVIPHDLERVPVGIVVLDVNQDGAVVRGTNRGSWGMTSFQLRCSVAGTTALFVLV